MRMRREGGTRAQAGEVSVGLAAVHAHDISAPISPHLTPCRFAISQTDLGCRGKAANTMERGELEGGSTTRRKSKERKRAEAESTFKAPLGLGW